nr:choloylglycine hydrolase [Oscillospiraceae bacterium]
MCTAVTYQTKDFYFGRTLDYDVSYAEEVAVTPRHYPLHFREMGTLNRHYAILGMAHVREAYPLYFDGVNEKGLAMAGLNFVGYARYRDPVPDKDNIAQFEFLPWLLAQCASVAEARERLARINLTAAPFCRDLPAAQLHWLLADRREAVTIEAGEEGLRVWDNPVGVLTNNPPFEEQLFRLNDYMHLSPREPENRFSKKLPLHAYSRGMGAIGLPGDLSSQSRFVRGAFVKLNSLSGTAESESVSQFFHILGAVSQPRGCCDLGGGKQEITLYSSCCNTDKGIYYYTTYDNHQITAVHMHREKLDDAALIRYPLIRGEQIRMQN